MPYITTSAPDVGRKCAPFSLTWKRTVAVMSNKQSGMIAFAERYAKNKVEAAQLLMIQYMADTLQMTLHQTEGWGYDRIMRLCAAWKETRQEYSAAIDPSNPEADVYQEHMDRVLAEIINGKQELFPFSQRYPELKKIKYGKR
nr:MAG TPA: hypothetical protein [Caudoviricetes sp.]